MENFQKNRKKNEGSFISFLLHIRNKQISKNRNLNKSLIKNDMAQATAHLCKNMPITKVVAITKSGFAARSLSLLNISQPIIAVSDNLKNARTFNLYPGTHGIFIDIAFKKKIQIILFYVWKDYGGIIF